MHVIVVGCGRVGSELAVRLQADGHSVVILDKQENAFRRLPESWGGRKVVGLGFDRDDLEEAGIRHTDALAAVTSGDNTNILTARIARETFSVTKVVARIYDPRRALIYQRLGIPTVATVSWTVDQVVHRLFPERATTSWTDPTGSVNLIEADLPLAYAGRNLSLLDAGERFHPVLLTRGGRARVITGEVVGQEGDVVLFAVAAGAMSELEERLKTPSHVEVTR